MNPENPPAFPIPDSVYPNGQVQFGTDGMTLRDWTAPADAPPAEAPANPAPTFSPTQVSRLLDALNLARNGCEDTAWEDALVALEEALCPEEGQ